MWPAVEDVEIESLNLWTSMRIGTKEVGYVPFQVFHECTEGPLGVQAPFVNSFPNLLLSHLLPILLLSLIFPPVSLPLCYPIDNWFVAKRRTPISNVQNICRGEKLPTQCSFCTITIYQYLWLFQTLLGVAVEDWGDLEEEEDEWGGNPCCSHTHTRWLIEGMFMK
jgi:hypothetical protein